MADILLKIIQLISPRLHQNKSWKSFALGKSHRHSRGELSPKISFASFLQLYLREAFLAQGLQPPVFAEGEGLMVHQDVMQEHERCLSPNHPERRGRVCSASASSASRPLSTDGARVMLPSSHCLAWRRTSRARSPQARLKHEAPHKGSHVASGSASTRSGGQVL